MTHAVLYRWRIHPGQEEAFAAAWGRVTEAYRREAGALGGRLHVTADGWRLAYARWPSAETRAAAVGRPDPADAAIMRAAILECLPEIEMDILDDRLGEGPAPGWGAPALAGGGVRLRKLDIAGDLPALHAIFGDEESCRYMTEAAFPTPAQTLAQMRLWHPTGTEAAWAITEPALTGDEALGRAALLDRGRETAEVAVMTAPPVRGRGLATRAIALLVEHGFAALRLRRLFADIDPDNAPSRALFARLGFREEGVLRAAWATHIGVRDAVIYGLLADDPRPRLR